MKCRTALLYVHVYPGQITTDFCFVSTILL